MWTRKTRNEMIWYQSLSFSLLFPSIRMTNEVQTGARFERKRACERASVHSETIIVFPSLSFPPRNKGKYRILSINQIEWSPFSSALFIGHLQKCISLHSTENTIVLLRFVLHFCEFLLLNSGFLLSLRFVAQRMHEMEILSVWNISYMRNFRWCSRRLLCFSPFSLSLCLSLLFSVLLCTMVVLQWCSNQ